MALRLIISCRIIGCRGRRHILLLRLSEVSSSFELCIKITNVSYRLNIFGFPNAAGLDDQNLGVLDQRMALEWVRDNIEAFGGDRES